MPTIYRYWLVLVLLALTTAACRPSTISLPVAPTSTAAATTVVEQEIPTLAASATATTAATATNPASTKTPPPSATPSPEPPAATATETREDIEATFRLLEQTDLPARDLYELAVRFSKIPADTPRIVSETDPGYQIGDVVNFNVSNIATGEAFDVDATLRAQTAHGNWWVANDVEADQEDLEVSAEVFETQTYPTNRAVFGSEWSPGIDGDVHVNIFLGDVAGVGGYFSSADEFPRSVNPNSNEKETFYLNIYNATPGTSYFDGILAHEFQHMIHWNQDRNEELWINEGMSELAAYVNNFPVGSALQSYLSAPDITVTRWEVQTSPFYGSAYAFARYLYERFGDAAISRLISEQANGRQGVAEAVGVSFDEVFADWTVANLISDSTVGEGQYDYTLADTPPGYSATAKSYPFSTHASVSQYGTDYYRFAARPGDGPLTIEFEGDPTVSLLPTDAYSGNWMLWGNRGDDSYSYAYRAFDLTGLDSATLNFWTWYDIEEEYDFGYLGLSTDGGTTWQLLETDATTNDNPHGNNFGNGYTGTSEWVEQTVDLSTYAGQEILVGFHYVTDDALNQNGFVVDDVSIPELNYAEDFEAGSEGWEFAGWARVDNRLPQHFILRAVLQGADGTTVLPLKSDATNHATLTVADFGTTVDNVVFIVTGATQETTSETEYDLRAEVP